MFGGNGWSSKRFIHKDNKQKQWITLYINSNTGLPYIDLLTKTKVIVLPQSGKRKFIDYSCDKFNFFVE